MDTKNSTAPAPHPSIEECPCICYDGVVFIGHLVEENGEEVEIHAAYPCGRCASEAR